MSYAGASAWRTAGQSLTDFGKAISDAVMNNRLREEERQRYREERGFRERQFNEGVRQFDVGAGMQKEGIGIQRASQRSTQNYYEGLLDNAGRRIESDELYRGQQLGLQRRGLDLQELEGGRRHAETMTRNFYSGQNRVPTLNQYMGQEWSPSAMMPGQGFGPSGRERDQMTARYMMEHLGQDPSFLSTMDPAITPSEWMGMSPSERQEALRLQKMREGFTPQR